MKSMVRLRTVLVVLSIASAGGCKKPRPDQAPTEPGAPAGSAAAGSAATGAGSAAAAPAWKLDSQPLDLACGMTAAATPAQAPPPADRALAQAKPIAGCQDRPTVDDVCKCLAESVATWSSGLSAKATCEVAPQGNDRVHLVEVHSAPDGEATAAGEAFVLVAAHGTAWSALGVVEAAPDVDLTTTPKAVHGTKIVAFETKPQADGALVWIQSRNQYTETGMGETDVNGAAQITICRVPSAAAQAPYCYSPVALATWEFTRTLDSGACNVRSAAIFAASLESTGALSVRLEHGADAASAAGHYHL